MRLSDWRNMAAGGMAVALCLAVTLGEWHLGSLPWQVLAIIEAFLFLLVWPDLRWSRRAFLLLGLGLALLELTHGSEGMDAIARAVGSAAFIGGFFTALSVLRNAAETDPRMAQAGKFLAERPPGRRYGALTLGGALFALSLGYGAIQLLGTLATSSARAEPDPEIRRIRTRRMLLAIQRGLLTTISWSPMSFGMVISTTVIPGASWSTVALPGMVTAVLFGATGWAMDTLFKPRRRAAAAPAPGGSARSLLPLGILLAFLFVVIAGLHLATGVRIVGIVMAVVPVVAAGWIVLQRRMSPEAAPLADRARSFLFQELPSYRGELTLLMMAAFIGAVGAPLLAPLLEQSALDPSRLPAWAILVGLVWLLPLCGQLGMNPIMVVILVAPMLPAPEAIGITSEALVVGITAGWALSGATSPFTATTLLIARFGGVSAFRVGLAWNGAFLLVCGVVLSIWSVAYALLG